MFPGSKSPILLIAGIAAGFATAHSVAEELLLEGARVAVVIRSGAPLRSGPSADAELVRRAESASVIARKHGYARLAALIDGRIWARAAPDWMKSWQVALALLLPLLMILLVVYRIRKRRPPTPST